MSKRMCAHLIFTIAGRQKVSEVTDSTLKRLQQSKNNSRDQPNRNNNNNNKTLFFLSLLSFFSMVPYEMKMYVLAGEGASFLPKNESTISELLLPSLAYERGGPGKIDLAKT